MEASKSAGCYFYRDSILDCVYTFDSTTRKEILRSCKIRLSQQNSVSKMTDRFTKQFKVQKQVLQ